jgi:hypothetical protein
MPTRYAGRSATIYFHRPEELKDWAEEAKALGCSLSNYVREMVQKGRDALTISPRADLSGELETLRRENMNLEKGNREKELLMSHYETELFKLRNQVFQEVDQDGTGEYDSRLVAILRQGKTVDGRRLLEAMSINPADGEAVKLLKNQLEELRRFGLVKETANGWRWVG